MKKTMFLMLAAILLNACATHKELMATGGSKSDGVIELGFEYGEMEKPIIDENKGIALASQRCRAWGYQHAEAFGGSKKQCTERGGLSGCAKYYVTKQYQCIG